MRQEPNKDIDLLLRELSRRNGVPVSGVDEQHLDADELNSYVANALPAAARARYTEHLADCSNCRKLVAQLSAAERPIVMPETASVGAPSGFKSFLASLFSPMVLRYAVPALGLMVIVAVGLIVFREEPKDDSVARVENTDQNKPVLQIPPTTAETPTQTPTATKKEAPPQRTVETPAAKDAPVAAAPPVSEPVIANEAAPPAPKATATSEYNAERAEELKKEKQAAADMATAAPAAASRAANQQAKTDHRQAEIAASPGSVTGRAIQVRRDKTGAATGAGQGVSRSEEAAKEGNFASGETRSVAGRRFRKTDGVWIDTAYDSAKGVTNVARGSEQYRALVGDEPAIRAIAEQLDGEIIVVWKGRAYRIR